MSHIESEKLEQMKKNGTFNRDPSKVLSSLFKDYSFFDPHDLPQVKYEMLRSVEKDGKDVSSTAKEFGFSRVSYYQIKEDYNTSGILGLIPKKRGPQGPRKLKPDDIEFIKKIMNDDNKITQKEMLEKLKIERNITISRRTLERCMSVKKKGK
jgi:transposase